MSALKLKVEVELPSYWGEEGDSGPEAMIISACADKVLADANKDLVQKVIASASKQVDAQVTTIVTEVIASGLHITNHYGEPTGEKQTMREVVAARVEKFLRETVDAQGRPSNGSYRNDVALPRIQWFVNEAVRTAFEDGFKKEMEKASAELKASLVGKLNTAMTETVAKLLGVVR